MAAEQTLISEIEAQAQALPGMEGDAVMNSLDAAQLQVAAARRVFEATGCDYPWLDVYHELRAEGWVWRQAIYIAWLAMPAQKREPKTQQKLATEVLGLASDRRLREWKRENPAVLETSIQLYRNRFFAAIPAVLEALVESASKPDGRNSATDRRTFIGMVGGEDQFAQREALPEDLGAMATEELQRKVRALEAGNDAAE